MPWPDGGVRAHKIQKITEGMNALTMQPNTQADNENHAERSGVDRKAK
jgi:hypothetical protein